MLCLHGLLPLLEKISKSIFYDYIGMKMNIAKLYFYLLTLKEIKALSWPLKVLWALGPVPSVSNGEISSDSPRLGK